jgi:hypothetical protein
MAPDRTWYHIGKSFLIEVTTCTNPGGKDSLPKLWKQNGLTTKELPTWLTVNTYYTDENGVTHGWYNVTQKLITGRDVHGMVIDFDYLLEATPENEMFLVNECVDMMLREEKMKYQAV